MDIYEQWQNIVNKILELIRKNEELLKYVCSSEGSVEGYEVPNWEDIILHNVFPMPKEPNSVSTEKTNVNVFITKNDAINGNPMYNDDYVVIDAFSHLDVWMMNDGTIRPYKICSLINEMLNQKYFTDLSIQTVLLNGTSAKRFGDMYFGYRMIFKLTNFGVDVCE